MKDEDAVGWHGYLYSMLLGGLLVVSTYARNFFLVNSSIVGVALRKGVTGLIFRKILKFSQKSKAKATSGKLVSLVSGELQLLERGFLVIPTIVVAPISLTFAFILIGISFKEAAFFGFIIAVIIIATGFVASIYTRRYKYEEGAWSSKRLMIISDIINGIRTIKAYAWELPFFKLASKYRNNQVWNLFKNVTLESSMWGVTQGGGVICGIVIFGYHFLMGREFNYEDSIAASALLGYITFMVFQQMYMGASMFSNFIAILRRVGEVLDMEEFEERSSESKLNQHDKNQYAIEMRNASLSFGFSLKKDNDPKSEIEDKASDVNLDSINFTASAGDLIAVVGTVGCGKSTFLSAIMNELVLVSGDVSLYLNNY
jgi:ABC-type multidrug transport system fused ATPase/permease subunit